MGIKQAIEPQFRVSLRGLENPYGTGKATPVIVERLKSISLGDTLIRKKFYDVPFQLGVSLFAKDEAGKTVV